MNPISLVLVTGATGFVGAHIVDELLRRGLKVRGTTRSSSKGDQMLRDRPTSASRLEFTVIGDLSQPGVFDEAVKGVDAIIHTASPVTYNIIDCERELLAPAINGTKSLLSAAQREPTVQRVIYTSSFASVIDGARLEQSGYTLTSDDWNPVTYEEATTADPVVAYRISKKYAELAAWDCIHNESPHFDLVSLCPPFIFGPLVHPVSKISDLNSSSQMIWEVASGTDPLPVARTTYWVDVRDLAFAHTEALLRREVGNRRFIITSPEQFTFQRAADILRQEFDWAKEEVTKGDEGAPIPKRYNVDSDTATKALGLQYRTFKECVLEAMTQIREIQQREKMEKRI